VYNLEPFVGHRLSITNIQNIFDEKTIWTMENCEEWTSKYFWPLGNGIGGFRIKFLSNKVVGLSVK
jgi:hypothetical protein